jgi:hypothetical protein
VLVSQHLFGVGLLDQATPDKGAQNAPAQIGLHRGHGRFINPGGWVKDDAPWCGRFGSTERLVWSSQIEKSKVSNQPLEAHHIKMY